jgi:hypothetical protein
MRVSGQDGLWSDMPLQRKPWHRDATIGPQKGYGTMASTMQSRQHAAIRTDGATMAERIAERIDALMSELADAEDTIQRWEEQYGYVPDDVQDWYQTTSNSLDEYAGYWGFDC